MTYTSPSQESGRRLRTLALAALSGAIALVMSIPPVADAKGAGDASPTVGYWTDSNAVIADAEGNQIGLFPNFDHFSFGGSLLAGEKARPRSHDRIVGYDIVSGDSLFRINNATNPIVGDGGRKVFFLPTYHREDYVMSVWMRNGTGAVRKIAQFKPGPGLPGIPHGMRAGGAPLDLALDERGRYAATAFGLETIRSFDVWIIDTKTKEATRMTRGENSHSPSLSPDGSSLAVRVESSDPCSDDVYGEILIGKIRVISRTTGESRTLTEFDCDVFYDTPRWIDNTSLAAVRVTKDASEIYGYDLDIVQIDPATGTVTELVTEGNPCCITVSPTLRKIAYPFSDVPGGAVFDLSSMTVLDLPETSSVPHLSAENRF